MYELLALFAQAPTGDISWGQVVTSFGSLGSAGFTGWLGYHLITKLIPDMLKNFAVEIEKARADYRLDIAAQRQHDAQQNEIERNECERRHREGMEREESRHRELLARIDSTHVVVRTIDHGVRDVQQSRAWAEETRKMQAKEGTKEMKGLEETQK